MLGRTSQNYKYSAREAHSYKNSSAHHFVPTKWHIKDKIATKMCLTASLSEYKSRIDARISVKVLLNYVGTFIFWPKSDRGDRHST